MGWARACDFFRRLLLNLALLESLHTTKKAGTKTTARQVEAIMPLKTLIPRERRALAPAPVASTRGKTPRMKAKEVMRIGRILVRAVDRRFKDWLSINDSVLTRDFDDQNAILGRQGDQKHQPDLNVKIIIDPEARQRCHGPEQRK
jgi:hypothetical protein